MPPPPPPPLPVSKNFTRSSLERKFAGSIQLLANYEQNDVALELRKLKTCSGIRTRVGVGSARRLTLVANEWVPGNK